MLQYSISIVIVTLSLCEIGCGLFTNEEGPFEIIVRNTTVCLEKEQPWFHSNITTYSSNGHTLLRGTVVTKRELKDVKFRIAFYYMEKGQLVKAFEIKNQKCRNAIVKLVLGQVGVPVNEKKCTMRPVKLTEFNNLNLNSIVHSVVQSIWYGDVRIRWEIAVPEAQVMCLDINLTSAKPTKTKF